MRNILKAVFFLAFILSFSVAKVDAGGTSYGGVEECVPVYGGGVQCPRVGEVLLNKTVRNPATGIFVDNLGLSDPKYRTQEVVTFKILVKNSGDETLDKVEVKDTLPDFVDFMEGPGSYDQDSKVLTFTVENLAGGESRTFDVTARTVHPSVLPEDKNVVCPVNVVDAQAGDQTDRDEAQFCIQKEVEAPEVPQAGPVQWLISLAGLSTAFVSGKYLRKKSRAN